MGSGYTVARIRAISSIMKNLVPEASGSNTTSLPDAEQDPKRKRRRFVLPVMLVLSVGLFLGISAYLIVEKAEREKTEYRFARDVSEETVFIKNSIESDLLITGVLKSFFYASSFVSREEFRIFTRDFLKHQKSLHAISWIPRVPENGTASLIEAARADGLAEFRISQRSAQGEMIADLDRDEYFPVYFIEPASGNEAAVGFNLASNERRLSALNKARDSGEKVATASITLVQETGNQAAILVFDPVYQGGVVPPSVEERREKLLGYISAVVRVAAMLEIHLQSDGAGFLLHVADVTDAANVEPLYGQENASRSKSNLKLVRTLSVAGRTWEMEFQPRAGSYGADLGLVSYLVLILPVLFAAALAAYLYQILAARDLVRDQVALKTRALSASEDRLEELVSELQRANVDLKRFAYVASHDLQEPLRKLQQFSEFLETDCSDELSDDAKYFLSVIRGSSNRMSQLIRDLLTYSRMQNREFEPGEVTLSKVVDGILSDFDVLISETNASIHVEALPVISADKTAVEQLVRNLIGNALKYRHLDRAPDIRISCPPLNERGSTELKIIDNGIGFDMKYSERIMQAFQRLHNKSEYSGTGIGLAICKSICERHGWLLDAESVSGEGATFTVTINSVNTGHSSGHLV